MQFAKISDNSSAILAASSIATSLLVVDDDPIQRRVIAKIGAQAGHRALTASSLAEATEILASQRIDCLTIDLGLGADSGLDLFQLIVAQGRKIEVLIISGAGEDLLEFDAQFRSEKRRRAVRRVSQASRSRAPAGVARAHAGDLLVGASGGRVGVVRHVYGGATRRPERAGGR